MNGNIFIPSTLQVDLISSAAAEAASSARLLVELPILACGNNHEPATTRPVITQMIPLCEWSHTGISERRCLDFTQPNTVCSWQSCSVRVTSPRLLNKSRLGLK